MASSDVGQKLSETWDGQRHDRAQLKRLYRSLARLTLAMSRVRQPLIGSFRFNDDGTIALANRRMRMAPTFEARRTYGSTDAFLADTICLYCTASLGKSSSLGKRVGNADMALLKQQDRHKELFTVQIANLRPENILVNANWNIAGILDTGEVCVLPLGMASVHWLRPREFLRVGLGALDNDGDWDGVESEIVEIV